MGREYCIVRETEFDRKLRKIAKDYSRLSELDNAIDWALARVPDFFTHVVGNYYFWVTEQLIIDEIPQLRILYKVDEKNRTVYLIDVDEVTVA